LDDVAAQIIGPERLVQELAELLALLTDVVMRGLNGFNLARMAVLRRPEIKVIYRCACAR